MLRYIKTAVVVAGRSRKDRRGWQKLGESSIPSRTPRTKGTRSEEVNRVEG